MEMSPILGRAIPGADVGETRWNLQSATPRSQCCGLPWRPVLWASSLQTSLKRGVCHPFCDRQTEPTDPPLSLRAMLVRASPTHPHPPKRPNRSAELTGLRQWLLSGRIPNRATKPKQKGSHRASMMSTQGGSSSQNTCNDTCTNHLPTHTYTSACAPTPRGVRTTMTCNPQQTMRAHIGPRVGCTP